MSTTAKDVPNLRCEVITIYQKIGDRLVPGVFLLGTESYICQILNDIETVAIQFEMKIFQNINTASDSGG